MEVGTRWPMGQVRMALRRWALSVPFGTAADSALWPVLPAPQLPHLRLPAAGVPLTPLDQVATPGRSDASGLIRLTEDPAIDRDPVWSPFP